VNELDAVEVLSSDITLACAGVAERYPGVMTTDQLVSDTTLRILDEGLTADLLDHEYPGERVWWIQGIAYRIVRDHLAEYDHHRENRESRQDG
jgi:hypothetical protein